MSDDSSKAEIGSSQWPFRRKTVGLARHGRRQVGVLGGVEQIPDKAEVEAEWFGARFGVMRVL